MQPHRALTASRLFGHSQRPRELSYIQNTASYGDSSTTACLNCFASKWLQLRVTLATPCRCLDSPERHRWFRRLRSKDTRSVKTLSISIEAHRSAVPIDLHLISAEALRDRNALAGYRPFCQRRPRVNGSGSIELAAPGQKRKLTRLKKTSPKRPFKLVRWPYQWWTTYATTAM